jgi:alcohol dehydrogenase class IV
MGFEFFSAARIVFGAGSLERLDELAAPLGRRALLVTGARSADESGASDAVRGKIEVAAHARCASEPRVEDVDRAVEAARAGACDLVVALGGGAVLDCGKAAAGMMTNPGSLEDYLEGVGKGLTIDERPAPMIAIPSTAGTGSEVTKNAVISGAGYKKSIRSPDLIPDVALVDPDLLATAPPALVAACGMDALTQVIESFMSLNASPLTDALAIDGIYSAGRFLERFWRDRGDGEARSGVALTSLYGGICLANAGLGAVHGFASPLGALFPFAHGEVCGSLLAASMEANLEVSRGGPAEERVWSRFAEVSAALLGDEPHGDVESGVRSGLARLHELRRVLEIPTLGELGLREEDVPQVVAGARGSSMRTNPVLLSDEQLSETLRRAL